MEGKKQMEENRIETPFSRTELLLGQDAMERLENARVAVFGVGGVGGRDYCATVGNSDIVTSCKLLLRIVHIPVCASIGVVPGEEIVMVATIDYEI